MCVLESAVSFVAPLAYIDIRTEESHYSQTLTYANVGSKAFTVMRVQMSDGNTPNFVSASICSSRLFTRSIAVWKF